MPSMAAMGLTHMTDFETVAGVTKKAKRWSCDEEVLLVDMTCVARRASRSEHRGPGSGGVEPWRKRAQLSHIPMTSYDLSVYANLLYYRNLNDLIWIINHPKSCTEWVSGNYRDMIDSLHHKCNVCSYLDLHFGVSNGDP